MTDFERFQCWDSSRIGQVINKEAISVDLADFLATHAPLGHISYVRSGPTVGLSEMGLLNELVSSGQNNRHVFAVIQGIPGTGKSHLIRWLYQRYLQDIGAEDEVLLIERAHNSLLGTLRQIIDKINIESEALRQQIEKLRGAVVNLSERALKDTLLDSIRIATYEREEVTASGRIRRGIDGFLLDMTIRNLLLATDGPIERIASFLTTGRKDGGDRPEFVADDFKMPADILRNVTNSGYQEARTLAEALDRKDTLREELAAYLNQLLDYAISKTVILSADDLKQTFNDLRRELRRNGKGLTLLIEDITAFTGIDLGLIDVLVTQHTGEGNQDFCRLTSVVGITDSYFRDRFPDNLQERITHHLTLNAGPPDQVIASLLNNQSAAADLAARYLNAIRANHATMRGWFEDGAKIERLPNRCHDCIHREACHAAFGAINIGSPDGMSVEVGLYPFNASMIWKTYQRLDSTTLSRTPRSLLYNVLYDVLQTHGTKIIAGQFPPPPKELVPGIHERDLPALAKPVQQRSINTQGGKDASRIQSLVLFWGDGTIDARQEGEDSTVGRLMPTVFRAFTLPTISGIPVDASTEVIDVSWQDETKEPNSNNGQGDSDKIISRLIPDPTPIVSLLPARQAKYDADIERWRTGSKLEQYEDLRKYLVSFIDDAIDWTMHGVATGIVDERITGRSFEIEGQAGLVRGERFLLKRSDELAYVLQALADLNTTGGQLEPAVLGDHLVTLGSWLRKHEMSIVNYVLQPTGEQKSPLALVELLTLDCLLLDMLCDNLKVESTAPGDLLKIILGSAGIEVSDRQSTDQDWSNQIERAKGIHSDSWTGLMRTIGATRARTCRNQFLKQLNQPQGRSSDIRYIDAATALDIVTRMRQRDWALRDIPAIEKRASPTWQSAGEVYIRMVERLEALFQEEKLQQQQLLDRLKNVTGDATPDEVIRSVESFLNDLKERGIPHSLGDLPAKGQGMRNMVQFLNATIAETRRGATATRLSASARYLQQTVEFIRYFEDVVKLAQRIGEQQDHQIEAFQSANEALGLEQQVCDIYDELIALLRKTAPVVAMPEVKS